MRQMGVKRDREESAEVSETSDVEMSDSNITADEAALYDRQIRLWGVECQKKIRSANILLIGLNGLGVEIAKNLALSGVNSITISDSEPVSEYDQSAQFFAVGAKEKEDGSKPTRAEASISGIQELNPNVKISIESEPLSSKEDSYYSQYHAVFASNCDLTYLTKLNQLLRNLDVLFFCGATWGFYGYSFLDLKVHNFTHTVKDLSASKDKKEDVVKDGSISYCPLSESLEAKVGSGLKKRLNRIYMLLHTIDQFQLANSNRYPSPAMREDDLELLKIARAAAASHLDSDESKVSDEMLGNVFGELSPVCAAVGGIMANEMIKGVSNSNQPINNFLLFDGDDCSATVETITKPKEEAST